MNAALGIIIGLIVGMAIMFVISYFIGGNLPWVKTSTLPTEKIGEILLNASQNTSNDANVNAIMDVCAQWIRTFSVLSDNKYVYTVKENNTEKKYDFTDFMPKDNTSIINPLMQFTIGEKTTQAGSLNWVKDSAGAPSYKIQMNTPSVVSPNKINTFPSYTKDNNTGHIEMFTQ